MLRDNCDNEELEAHRVLDLVKAGASVPASSIDWALFVLGDGVGLVELKGMPWKPIACV
jgi:hypothetical protein